MADREDHNNEEDDVNYYSSPPAKRMKLSK
jgi:hypothetical protein